MSVLIDEGKRYDLLSELRDRTQCWKAPLGSYQGRLSIFGTLSLFQRGTGTMASPSFSETALFPPRQPQELRSYVLPLYQESRD